MQTPRNEQEQAFKQTEKTKKFFEGLNEIEMNIGDVAKNDLGMYAALEAGDSLIKASPEELVKHIFANPNTQVHKDFKDAFEKLRLEAEELFDCPLRAIKYIKAYLADVNTDQQEEWTKLNNVIHDNMFYGYDERIQNDNEKCIVREKIIKVMDKLGNDRLKELIKNPNEIGKISLLEKIGHYINEVIRAATFGLAGYELSDKEAKEALNSGLNSYYDQTQNSTFSDGNTRFAQVVKKERLIIREAAAAMSSFD